MALFISQNGEQVGPLTDEAVQTELQKGRFAVSDWAWEEGMDDWRPLAEIQRFSEVVPDSPNELIPDNGPLAETGPPPLPAATQQQITPSSRPRPFLSKRGWLKLIYWTLATPIVLGLLVPAVCSGFGMPLGDDKQGDYPLACLFVGLFLGMPFRRKLRSVIFSTGIYAAGWMLAFACFLMLFSEVAEIYRDAHDSFSDHSKVGSVLLDKLMDYMRERNLMPVDVRDFGDMLFQFIGKIFFKPFPAVTLVAIGALVGPLGKAVMRRLGLRT